jgi:predicted membrane protein
MKMGNGLFWGIILILIGISLIIKVVFKVDFPIGKVLFAFFFIYLGIKILIGNFGFQFFKTGPNDVVFGEANYVHERFIPKEQNVIFGRGVFDLRNISPATLPAQFHINTVFGNSDILVNKNLPVKIMIDAAFAGVTLPNDNSTVFGSVSYQTPSYDDTKPSLKVKADAVFGGLRIIAY